MIDLTFHEVLIRFIDAVLIGINILAWIVADHESHPALPKPSEPSSGQKPKINMWYEAKTTHVTTRDIRQDAKG